VLAAYGTARANAEQDEANEQAFDEEVKPILKNECSRCHSGHKREGGFSMNTRADVIAGGDEGAAIVLGKSAKSNLIARLTSDDPDSRMPKGGKPLSAAQIATLKKWIDAGAAWPEEYNLAEWRRAPIAPRKVELPPPGNGVSHPIDRLLVSYFAALADQKMPAEEQLVGDRVFMRRVWLDLAGLLPPTDDVERFVADQDAGKRAKLVDRLLGDNKAYAGHWMTFWSDILRNAYRGTGYIDGGRKSITKWLYASLHDNKPYDQFTRELISGAPGSEGFINGIKWRGTVNASQRREMQAAQNVAQIFLGTNLKCASCHDSFVNHWRLVDAYNLAAVFADGQLELHRCDKPAGKHATPGFIYKELGEIDSKVGRVDRMKQLAEIITSKQNGRLPRTIVNRLWAQLLGRGIVEPIDDMDQEAWNEDLLDWLAGDFVANGYDLKHTLRLICTSRAYQMAPVGASVREEGKFAFRGPVVRRMSAEQFVDSISKLTGTDAGGYAADIPRPMTAEPAHPQVRSVLTHDDPLNRALGRPNREQVVTQRDSLATTLQALELTNGGILADRIKRGAAFNIEKAKGDAGQLVEQVYKTAIGRAPTDEERSVAMVLVGDPMKPEGVEDLLWVIAMLPEFQLLQ
jgi:hypothetical protein